MFFHRKELMYDVKVQGADPRFGEMLLEQFGGATGELSAAPVTMPTRRTSRCCRGFASDLAE